MNENKRVVFMDVLKFIALIFMPILHAFGGFILFGTIGEAYPWEQQEIVMNVLYWFTPSVFMLCMGMSLHLSRHREPAEYAKRGLRMLGLFLALNFLRYPLPSLLRDLIYYGSVDGAWLQESAEWLVGNDILAFAGLFFLLYALIRRIGKSDLVLALIAMILFFGSTLIPTDISFENGIWTALVSNFIYLADYTYFPILNWFIIPVLGYLFYRFFAESKDKDRFMLGTFAAAAVLFAVSYLAIGKTVGIEARYFLWGEREFLFDIPTMLFLLEINFAFIPVIYFLSKGVEKIKWLSAWIAFEAANINRIYCVHWVILMFAFLFLSGSPALVLNAAAAPYLWGTAVLIVSSLIVFGYQKVKRKH